MQRRSLACAPANLLLLEEVGQPSCRASGVFLPLQLLPEARYPKGHDTGDDARFDDGSLDQGTDLCADKAYLSEMNLHAITSIGSECIHPIQSE